MKPIARGIIEQIVNELYGQPVLSNLARPLYIEKLLVRLLKGGWRHVGSDWSGWDLEDPHQGLRIEVKQSAARQTWTDSSAHAGKATTPVFDIRERSGYYVDGGSRWIEAPGRAADLYIFAWHPVFEPICDVDHTDPEQWEFYLLPERLLPAGQKTIRLNSLLNLDPVLARSHDIGEKVEALQPKLAPLKNTTIPK